GRAQGSPIETPRLVRVVEEEAGARQGRHGVSRRAEVDLELRPGGEGLVLPPLLRLSGRPQHLASAGAGGDPQDHRLLDFSSASPGSAWTPCRSSSPPRAPTSASPKSSTTCCGCSTSSCSGGRATASCSPKPTCCPRPTWNISAPTATACT